MLILEVLGYQMFLNKLRKLAEEKKIKNDNRGVLEITKDEKNIMLLLLV